MLEEVWSTGPIVRRKQPISYKSYRKKLLCGDCQTHFKHLEDRTIPLFERLESRQTCTFSAAECATLGEWGAKTAICLIFAEEGLEDLVPADERFSLRKTGKPSTETWIGYAAWDGPATLSVNDLTSTVDPIHTATRGYSVVATTRRVALKVVSRYGETSHEGADIVRGLIEQVWPVKNTPLLWPPVIAFNRIEPLILFFP
jgi:hypothetical protein